MQTPSILLYGANGYTGKLTAKLAHSRGLKLILGGRNRQKVGIVARPYGFETRIFGLDDVAAAAEALADIDLVIHMAGPFSATSRPMIDACIASKTHYMDITGEIPVIEATMARDAEAKAAGVVLVPGVGFDVVPTDCVAAMLKKRMPDAEELELAFSGSSTLSPGTTKTMIEGMGQQAAGAARIDGKIVPVPAAWKRRMIAFPNARPHVVSIPWGDVASAFHSTGIGNIVTYAGAAPSQVKWLKVVGLLRPVLGLGPVQSLLKSWVEKRVKGPNEQQRESGFTDVYGEVRNADGQQVSAVITTPEGYSLTARTALKSAEKVLDGDIEPGAKTPAMAFGAEFILSIDGVHWHGFSDSVSTA